MQVVSTGIPLVRLPQGVERKMNYKARFILEHCGGFTKRQYNLYLSVNTDDEFIAELKRLPVFTYIDDSRESCSKLFVHINPTYDLEEIRAIIKPLVNALEMRAGRPDGYAFEHCGPNHEYYLYLSVNTDDEFIAELKRLPVFTYVRDDRESCSKLFVSVNPVIGVKSAERQIRTLVKALAERQR